MTQSCNVCDLNDRPAIRSNCSLQKRLFCLDGIEAFRIRIEQTDLLHFTTLPEKSTSARLGLSPFATASAMVAIDGSTVVTGEGTLFKASLSASSNCLLEFPFPT